MLRLVDDEEGYDPTGCFQDDPNNGDEVTAGKGGNGVEYN